MIFDEQIARKPDHYPWARELIDSFWAIHWTPNEFSFVSDYQDFKTSLTEEQRKVIVRTLSAIGQIEISVKKFWSRLGENLPHPGLTDLGFVMAHTEVIHNVSYEKLLNILGITDAFEENLKLDIIRGRVNYLRKYLEKNYKDNKKQYVYSLALFTLFVENVSLFSQFYIVLWFNRFRNKLKDSSQMVQYTRLEEGLHAQAGIKIIETIKKEYPDLFDADLKQRIEQEANEAFIAESKIIDWMLNGYSEENLNAQVLKEYVKNRLNESLVQIGCASIFEIDSDLIAQARWMDEELMGNTSTDFFNKRPVEYSKGHSFTGSDLF